MNTEYIRYDRESESLESKQDGSWSYAEDNKILLNKNGYPKTKQRFVLAGPDMFEVGNQNIVWCKYIGVRGNGQYFMFKVEEEQNLSIDEEI